MKSSVSGLSLFVHLLIIGVATLAGYILGPKGRRAVAVAFTPDDSFMGRAFKQALSIVIIVVLASVMLLATSVAITTGIREGANEPHRKYLAQQMRVVQMMSLAAWERVELASQTVIRSATSPTIIYTR